MLASGEPLELHGGFESYEECIETVWAAQKEPFETLNKRFQTDNPDYKAYATRSAKQFNQLMNLHCLPRELKPTLFDWRFWVDS